MNYEFFDACKRGDLKKVEILNQSLTNKREDRHLHFYGFTGIHYAAYYGQLAVFQFLFSEQKNFLTLEEITVIKKKEEFQHVIPPKSNVLELAIISQKIEIIKFIVTIFQQNARIFIAKRGQKRRLEGLLRESSEEVRKYVRDEVLVDFKKVGCVKNGLLGDFD